MADNPSTIFEFALLYSSQDIRIWTLFPRRVSSQEVWRHRVWDVARIDSQRQNTLQNQTPTRLAGGGSSNDEK
jgi:hypothetical protein